MNIECIDYNNNKSNQDNNNNNKIISNNKINNNCNCSLKEGQMNIYRPQLKDASTLVWGKMSGGTHVQVDFCLGRHLIEGNLWMVTTCNCGGPKGQAWLPRVCSMDSRAPLT